MGLDELVELSQFYGRNPDYVIAGGGNTSFKTAGSGGSPGTLWIKGSGVCLGDIDSAGFAAMDRKKLAGLWDLSGSADAAEREKAVLAGMMDARLPGEEHKRPSVETLLHDLLPFNYVVHTHPALVNGLTCSQRGEAAMRSLFGGESVSPLKTALPKTEPGFPGEPLWIPISDPGFVLALTVRDKLEERKRSGVPAVIFLQNHGIFVAGNSPEDIKALYAHITDAVKAKIKRHPVFDPVPPAGDSNAARAVLEEVSGEKAIFALNSEFARIVESRAAFAPVSSAFTPDHIVYAGSDPLFVEKREDPAAAWKAHREKTGITPKIAAFQGLGVFGTGPSEKAAALALALFTDTVKVAVYAENFGGPLFMTREKISFINTWEAEQYRSKQVH